MAVINDTEVIVSEHQADDVGGVESQYRRSPSYRDTHVTAVDRVVTFRNGAFLSDDSSGKERKFRCRAIATGDGVHETGEWMEFSYTSPVSGVSLVCEVPVDVPDDNKPEYEYDVSTEWELYQRLNGLYIKMNGNTLGPLTASVFDDSIGG